MQKFYIATLVGFLALFSGSQVADALEGDDDTLDMIGFEDVEGLARENYEQQILEDEVARQSERTSPKLPSYSPPTGDSLPDLIARIGYLEEEMRNLSGEVTRLEHELEQVQKNNAARVVGNEKSLKGVAGQYIVRPGDVNEEYVIKVEDNDLGADEEDAAELEEADFDAAIADVSEQNLAAAKDKFMAFTTVYPESEKLNEAYFWIGEICMDENDYKGAALNYLRSYKADKEGKRSEEALLKSSTALGKLGKKEEACRNLTTLKTMEGLQEVIKAQANSEAIKLGCEG